VIILKSADEIDYMKTASKVTSKILFDLYDFVKPGISTKDIDVFVEKRITDADMIPSFKGYNGFPASTCVSVNEEVVHGIPIETRILNEGDIVSIDIGATYKGFVSDAARTYAVGKISDEAAHIIKACRESFFEGVKYCYQGMRLSDISHAIQEKAEAEGFSVVRDLVGHGVGENMHEDPQIPNYGNPGKGPKLLAGMTLAIEPMINAGTYEVGYLEDNWTIISLDRSLSAHYENTVVITEGEPEIITLMEEEYKLYG
jgi:methionyl aminopeptidase